MLSSKLPWELANPRWASELNPIISNPASNMIILNNVVLVSGSNTINHSLGRTQQGWTILDQDASATFYRVGPFTNTTLTLNASGNVTVSIGVF